MPDIRVLPESDWRPAVDLFFGAVHEKPLGDAQWTAFSPVLETGRVLGAVQDGELVGTASSLSSSLCVPGGADVPMAGVSLVGVRADRTRRGVLRALMREQFGQFLDRGEPVATLRASEARIYRRFGYGIASRCIELTIDPARAGLRTPRTVHALDTGEAHKRLPDLYRTVAPRRPGLISRTAGWWSGVGVFADDNHRWAAVVHQDGTGYATYTVHRETTGRVLTTDDIWAADPATYADLWAYLLSVDLVPTVVARHRPRDEPLDLLLADPRAARITGSEDETWLRLVDVPAALAARGYGPAEVVLGVEDDVLTANCGGYRIGQDGAVRTDAEPELHCDVATLAQLYLGDRRPSQLAMAGLLRGDQEALRRADTVFGGAETPWCGTFF